MDTFDHHPVESFGEIERLQRSKLAGNIGAAADVIVPLLRQNRPLELGRSLCIASTDCRALDSYLLPYDATQQ